MQCRWTPYLAHLASAGAPGAGRIRTMLDALPLFHGEQCAPGTWRRAPGALCIEYNNKFTNYLQLKPEIISNYS